MNIARDKNVWVGLASFGTPPVTMTVPTFLISRIRSSDSPVTTSENDTRGII